MEKCTIFKIQHEKRDEVIVPPIAISNNIEFMLNGGEVEFAGGERGFVKKTKEVHMLSQSTKSMINKIYGDQVTPYMILSKWYKNEGERIGSLFFIHFKVDFK